MKTQSVPQAPIGILGRGLSGRAAKRLFSHSNISPDQVFLFDENSIAPESLAGFLESKKIRTLLVSPGVPLVKPAIQDFIRGGGTISGELEYAYQHLQDEKVLCVTGSVGKSTVAALLHAGLLAEDPNAFVGGNFGYPLADYVADVLEGKRPRARWLVLELSSYQLENFPSLVSDGTILTSLVANHLERYPTKEAYYDSKWTLAEKTRGPIVCNINGEELRDYVSGKPARPDLRWTSGEDGKVPAEIFQNTPLLGAHNRDNLAVAYTLLDACGIGRKAIANLSSFAGLAHRVENCGVRGGILCVNDSKATTMSSVVQAVNTIETQLGAGGSLLLLLGGRDKNLPWQELGTLTRSTIKPIFFGEFAAAAKEKSGLAGNTHAKLGPAIEQAVRTAKSGDIILLSPGGSSLDEFANFEERGNYFKSEIARLMPSRA